MEVDETYVAGDWAKLLTQTDEVLDELYRRQPLEMMGQKGQKNLNFVTLAAAINFVCKQAGRQ